MVRPTNKQKRKSDAKELLDNVALIEIFAGLKEELRDKWQTSTTTDSREAVYYEITALELLRDEIRARAESY